MVRRACGLLIREGSITAQDRWEEARGYSPSTLAVHIAALICGAEFFDDRGDHATADFVRDYADFLESHIEPWTVTTEGTPVPGIRRHYIRVNPASSADCADENANAAPWYLPISLLALAWRRYNHDGYGQREEGPSYSGWGKGRPWPLLTGERGHYEIAAGRDATPYLRALENFSQAIGLIPEQIWDGPDLPNHYLRFGGTNDATMPLLWAHSEYVKLHRSAADGKVFDLVEPAYERYVRRNSERQAIEVWKSNGQVRTVPAGALLRIQANSPFLLHWTSDDWLHSNDTKSQETAVGVEFRGYCSARGAERQHSIHLPLARRKSLGRHGLHSE
jgi:glucoamylase